MALLLSDGFRLYNTVAGALQVKGWTCGASVTGGHFVTGRTSTSRAVQLQGPVASRTMSQTLTGFSGTTSILSCAVLITSGTTAFDIITSYVGGKAVRVASQFATTGYQLMVYENSTLIATLPGLYAASTWYYFELKVLWATSGNVTVRVDGSVMYNAPHTLAAPTAGLTVGLRDALATSAVVSFADLLAMDGSGSTFNDFQGDVTIETLFPTADGASSAWTRGPVAETITGRQLVSNVVTLNLANSHSFMVGETITVAGLGAPFDGSYTVSAVTSAQVSYAKVNANVTFSAASGTVTGGANHWGTVDEIGTNRGDSNGDYVYTATVNAVDTYVMEDLVTSSTAPVLAVRPIMVARKESAAIMGIAAVVRIGGINYPGTATDLTNTLAYAPVSDLLLASPATASQWTRSEVNGMELGPKKTA